MIITKIKELNMSEQETNVPEDQKVEEIVATPPDHETIIANFKQSLLVELNNRYAEFIKFVVGLPIADASKYSSIHHLDTGLLWLEKSVQNAQIQLQKKDVAEPVADPVVNDAPVSQYQAEESDAA
jgi:hypothetical protein